MVLYQILKKRTDSKRRRRRIPTRDATLLTTSSYKRADKGRHLTNTPTKDAILTLGSLKVAQDVHKYTNSKRIEL